MLEVVFDKNAATGLRRAKDSRPGIKWFSIKAGIYPKGDPARASGTAPAGDLGLGAGAELDGTSADVAPLTLALDVGDLAAGAVLLEPALRWAWADRWRELVSENAPLQTIVNGRLSSVAENFYDFALRAALPEEPVKMAQVLVGALTALPGVGDGWLYRRLLAMLETGELREIAPGDGKHPYSAMIQRVK